MAIDSRYIHSRLTQTTQNQLTYICYYITSRHLCRPRVRSQRVCYTGQRLPCSPPVTTIMQRQDPASALSRRRGGEGRGSPPPAAPLRRCLCTVATVATVACTVCRETGRRQSVAAVCVGRVRRFSLPVAPTAANRSAGLQPAASPAAVLTPSADREPLLSAGRADRK